MVGEPGRDPLSSPCGNQGCMKVSKLISEVSRFVSFLWDFAVILGVKPVKITDDVKQRHQKTQETIKEN